MPFFAQNYSMFYNANLYIFYRFYKSFLFLQVIYDIFFRLVHTHLKIMWRKVIMNYLGIKEVKDKYRAVRIRKNLSILYAFLGWNCFGVIFYILIKDKIPIDKTERSISIFLSVFRSSFGRKTNKILILL